MELMLRYFHIGSLYIQKFNFTTGSPVLLSIYFKYVPFVYVWQVKKVSSRTEAMVSGETWPASETAGATSRVPSSVVW